MKRTILAGLGLAARAAESFGENLVEVKLALPKGETYIRGATDPVLDLVAEITLTNTSEKEKREKETITIEKAEFVGASDLSANTIKVVTERGVVYLMGRVTETEAKRAVELARSVSGVQKVVRVFEIISAPEVTAAQPAPASAPAAKP